MCEACRKGQPEKVEDPWYHDCDMCDVKYPHLHIRPMSEVLNYSSCDAGAYGGTNGWDTLEGKLQDAVQIKSLRTLIERDGFRQGYGVAVTFEGNPYSNSKNDESPWIHDGHHRMSVLFDMGAEWCPVQRNASHGSDTEEYRKEKRVQWEERYGYNPAYV